MPSTNNQRSSNSSRSQGSSLLKRRQRWWRWGLSSTRLILLLLVIALGLLLLERSGVGTANNADSTVLKNSNTKEKSFDSSTDDGRRVILKDFHIQNTTPPKPKLTYEQRRFLQTIPQRTPPDLERGQAYFTSGMSSKITTALKLSKIKITGFNYCKMLDGSIFNAMVYLHPLKGSIATLNPLVKTVISLLDDTAEKITEFIKIKFETVDVLEAHRYACYAVAEGNNPSANLTDVRFVVSFDPNEFFHTALPSIRPTAPLVTPSKKRYLVAFLIMVHEDAGLHQLKMLIDLLDDGNAIILIHVDKSAQDLYIRISEYLADRSYSSTAPKGNLFLAQNRFANTWGHISLVYTQLSGFWELVDLADWDYIVNLSNYDWPLRNNVDMHAALSLYPRFSWIDYWNDTEAIADRFLRPHLARADHSTVYHPPELSITSWPFSHWRAYKQMQWMVLTREAVQFFRKDKHAINYLAFMEHTLLPEESFFATALVNSKLSSFLKRDKKRYVRSPYDHSSPPWIGWSDRHIFRPSQTDPEFIFLRPFNVLGEFFGETKLIEWIRVNHLTIDPKQPCYRDQLGYRDECLEEIAATIAENNELILIPVNLDFIPVVENLRCSLLKFGMRNILHWAIDIQTHDKLIEAGFMSFFMPNIKGGPNRYVSGTPTFNKILRHKPKVIQRLLDAGFHVVYLDADLVVTRDFRDTMRKLVSGGVGDLFSARADVLLAIQGDAWNGETDPQQLVMAPTDHITTSTLPKAMTGIMYFRNTPGSKRFIEDVIKRQGLDLILDDQEAVREAVAQTRNVIWTGVGLPLHPNADPSTQDSTSKSLLHPQSATSSKNNGGLFSGNFAEFFRLAFLSKDEAVDDGRTRVHFLDQIEFVSGDLYFGNHKLLPVDYTGFQVIHTGGTHVDVSYTLKKHGLWTLDKEGRCLIQEKKPSKGLSGINDETRYHDVVEKEIAKSNNQEGWNGESNNKDISHFLGDN
ncbi:Xylosyltransferase 2 [Batrachochytrium dendrobatidis]|nr:Xylosyltransferase 2 [Batrachochytrium dendrobatidis]